MAITIRTEDGRVYRAESFEELVTAMRKDTWYPFQSDEQYMAGVARRCKLWDGVGIQYHDARSFIKELQRVGVIVEMVEGAE